MELTPEIIFMYVLLVGALISFYLEKISADLTAMTLFAIVLVTGLLPVERALQVFANPAPITVAAMFILSAALTKCGLIDMLAGSLQRFHSLSYARIVFFMVIGVAGISAFINNTPVVVVFMPVILALAKRMDIPASKLLIPLSYASIFGGTCTLIGTSTNLLVSGIAQQRGEAPFGMFEISMVGIPMAGIGLLYILLFGKRLLPTRETITSILSEDERREYITEAFIHPSAEIVGKTVEEAGLVRKNGIRVVEVVRNGVAVPSLSLQSQLKAGDRLVLSCRPSGIAQAREVEGLDLVAEAGLGLEQIAAHEGTIVEAIIGPNSALIGRTVREINFRQRYRVIILALHRQGRNLRDKLEQIPLQFGDTLLLLGTDRAINNLRSGEDLLLLDRPHTPVKDMRRKIPLVLLAITGVIGAATFGFAQIEMAAIVAVVFLMLTRILKPAEGYGAIQWNILFIIFGMLGMGLAMQETGAAQYLAYHAVLLISHWAAEPWQPLLMLAVIYLITTFLTEILSNNAAAVLLAVLAFSIAEQLGVDVRPFLIAVAIAASASFATPIGYQTNTYIYGAGGYHFSDFVKFGLPLNLLYFVGAMILIPRFWDF
ncbi:MAG: SLC13 family permease [Opitutales bacterium]|nr:SLC13 family permease [Opitutales bacterium]